MFIKVSNLFANGKDGVPNYKGLEFDNISNSLYPEGQNTCYFEYDGEEIDHEDIQIITEEEYNTVKQTEENKPRPKSEIEILKEENALLKERDAKMTDDLVFVMEAMAAAGLV